MALPLRRYWALLAQYLTPLRGKVALLTVLIFTTIGLQLINPQIVRFFIDTARTGGEMNALLLAALAFLGASLLIQLVSVAATYLGEDIGWRSTNQLRSDLAHHCLRLDMSFHNDHTPGEMIERIDGDVADIAIFFSQFVIRILGNLLLLVGVLTVLLWEDWRISLALAVYTGIALGGLIYFRQIAVPHWRAARETSADLFGFIEEQLAGTEDVRASGAVGYVMRNLFKFNKARLDKELTAGTMSILLVMMWIGLYTIGQIVAITLGFTLFRSGVLTLGAVYLVIHYTDMIFHPLREITNQIQNLQKAAAGIDRVESLYTLASKLTDSGQARLPEGALTVTFDHVSFGYQEDDPVLRAISFRLAPGEVLGLLGRTGSGKTTLTRLLFRLYVPTAGAICLGQNGDPVDLRQIGMDDLRGRIGMVTQDVQLFAATVRENLTFFDPTISDERILAVIGELGLWPWYTALPAGLDTHLEAEGHGLSAGEAQLLAFTRVFLKNPGLVILDEASSRLDPATEALIEQAVARLLQDRTGIIIAHRLHTVHRADKILILEGGQIREFGEYAALASDPNSRFYQLLQTGLEEVLA